MNEKLHDVLLTMRGLSNLTSPYTSDEVVQHIAADGALVEALKALAKTEQEREIVAEIADIFENLPKWYE